MKLAIMQPYFFPYIGYFQLINAVDEFILLDDVQFIRHGWIERNRVLKQNNEWLYIKVPLEKHSRGTLIKDINIRHENWEQKIMAQLIVYKKIAPYYSDVIKVVSSIFEHTHNTITELNYHIIKTICVFLEINTPIFVFSKTNLGIKTPTDSGEWALNISKSKGAQEYINPVAGKELFDKNKFKENNIELKFFKSLDIEYSQKREGFEPFLSIIDVMMFNSVSEIKELLDKYKLTD